MKKNIIFQKIGKKIMIFDSKKSLLYSLNETASYIWKKLRLRWNKKQIISGLSKKYEASKSKIEIDYNKITRDMKKKKII